MPAGPLFRTIPVPATQQALYQLSIRAPGNAGKAVQTYTFPLSPSSLRTDRAALATVFDTQGASTVGGSPGVRRRIDRFGITPPTFYIEGTTGWDQHNTDGYAYTGLQSLQTLVAFINAYEFLNKQQVEANNSQLYTLEFYDYFLSQFWQIEPIGPQIVRQSVDRPLLTYYRFVWAAYALIGVTPTSLPDETAQQLSQNPSQAIDNTSTGLGAITSAYTPIGTVTGSLTASFGPFGLSAGLNAGVSLNPISVNVGLPSFSFSAGGSLSL